MASDIVSIPLNFLGLPPELSFYATSKVAIIPVSYDSTTSYRSGSREGPVAIIQASRFVEFYDAQLGKDFTRCGIATLPVLSAVMKGPEHMVNSVEKVVAACIQDEKYPVLLGGEHTLSIGMVRALCGKFPNMAVLQIDAHLDLRDTYEGAEFNHACTMRRIIEICPIVQVGIRSVSEEEHEYVVAKGLQPHYSWEMRRDANWQQRVLNKLPKYVYVTIDLDGLDPSIMPAVGTPEPDGLLWHQLMEMLDILAAARTIVGFDVVELCPIPGYIASDYIAAKLVYRLIALGCTSTGLTF